MIRKSLFWGLTLVLVAALVILVIRGRKMEKEQAEQPVEVVRQAPSSPTRVLAPQDLDITAATMQPQPNQAVLHAVEIKNHGSVPYGGILLRFVYQDRAGNWLLTKTYSLNKIVILPGLGVKVPEIEIKEIPAAAEKFQVGVQYADMLRADSAIVH
jgi:hypothetical protein